MTKKEIVNRNIGLTFDFVREVLKDPSIIKSVPNLEIEQARAYTKSVIKKAAITTQKDIYKIKTSDSSFPKKVAKLNKLLSKAKLIK
mgnify:CR=1 FL=1